MAALNSIWFIRRLTMAKKRTKKHVNGKAAAANDTTIPEIPPRVTEEQIVKAAEPQTQKEATKTGAAYHVLAGRPAKQQVVYVFGKTGYALSWQNRAVRMGISTEQLVEEFKSDPEGLKQRYAAATEKKPTTESK